MRRLITYVSRISDQGYIRGVLAAALGLSMASSLYAAEITVSENSFSCIRNWTKVRNTYITHSDPEKLKEAVRIFKSSVPDKEYPVGTFLQLLPDEAMVKHSRQTFPKTHGWEFFHLELSAQGTKIRTRGDNVENFEGEKCFTCHQPAVKYDFVCEKGHGCAPVPLDDQKIAELQAADPRCPKN
jgi:hypothetical protein